MGVEGQGPKASPVAMLSLCLSILAVALSGVSLLMVHDYVHRVGAGLTADGGAPARQPALKEQIARVEKVVEDVGSIVRRGDEKSSQSAEARMKSVRDEVNGWVRSVEPRLRDAAASLSEQVEDVRTALKEQSAGAGEKLDSLRESLRSLREKVAGSQSESPKKPEGEQSESPKKEK